MKSIRKVIVIVAISSVIVIGIIVIGWLFFGWFATVSESDAAIAKKLEGYNADIMVYGDMKPSKQSAISYRMLSGINEVEIEKVKDTDYHMIVVSDLNGKLNLENSEYQLLLKYCTEKNYDLMYFGNAHIDKFREAGFFSQDLTKEWAFSYSSYQYRNDFPYELVDGVWKVIGEEAHYVANPYVSLFGYDEEDNRSARRESIKLWRYIAMVALTSLE